MANRSYLYSSNVIPGPDAESQGRTLIGIAEWNYDIPIVFKLLLSGNPRTCSSSIWGNPEEIALMGDYAAGVKNLEIFLSRIDNLEAQDLIAQAIEFLKKPESQNQYFILECGEIFDMEDAPVFEQNLALLEQVKDLQLEVEKALQSLVPPPVEPAKPVGLLSRLFGRSPEPVGPAHDVMKPIYDLGLGNWSHILYFDFSEE